jgi:hypothetical protein
MKLRERLDEADKAHSNAGTVLVHSLSHVIAIVEGDDIVTMDAVIDKIGFVPKVLGTDSKVARWIK